MRFEWNDVSKTLSFLLILNVVLFVLPKLISLFFQISYGDMLVLFGGLVTNLRILDGEFWRFLTANFLHADELHLVFNMLALYSVGRLVDQYYGGKYLFSFYIISGLVGGVFSLVFAPNIFTVGASGAVFGLLGVVIANTRKRNAAALDFPVSLMEVLPMAGYSLLFGFLPNTNINNAAHIGGLIAGLVLGFLFDHKLKFGRKSYEKVLENALYGFSLVVFSIGFIWPLIGYSLALFGL